MVVLLLRLRYGGFGGLNEPQQVVDGVGHEVVVEAGLVVGVGQMKILDTGAFHRQVGGQCVLRLLTDSFRATSPS